VARRAQRIKKDRKNTMADPPCWLPPRQYLGRLPNVGQGDVSLALPPPVAPRPALGPDGDAARPSPADLSVLARDGEALARAADLLAATPTDHLCVAWIGGMARGVGARA
jgi:hypothetical protein